MATKFWKITNHISTATNLVLIDAYTDQVLPSVFFYEQTLQLVPLPSTELYIKPNAYDTVVLPDPHRDTAGNTMPYTFIIAKAETLAPIAAIVCPADGTPSDLEVTDDMFNYIKKVYDFIKNIAAFPTSDLSKNFVTAMNDGSDSAIQAFFDGTTDYKYVKIDDVHLVQTYYKALPYGWTGGRNTKFYLYAKDYKNNTDTDEPVADLNISNDWTLPIAVSPDSAKFKMELNTYDDKKTIQLGFKDGAFWDSTTTDTPKLVLAGSFIMPSQLTGETSRNEIEAYLLGNLYGYDVFGLSSMAPHDQDDDGGFLDVFAVHNFKEGLDLTMYFISIGMGISFLVGCYYAVKYIKNKFNSDDALETIKKAQEIKEYIRQNNETLAGLINERVRVIEPENIPVAQVDANQQLVNANLRAARVALDRMIDCQLDSITALASIHADANLQTIMDALDGIQTSLDGTLTDVGNLIDGGVCARLQVLNGRIAELRVNGERHMTEGEIEDFNHAQENYNNARELEFEYERAIADIRRGENEQEAEPEPELEGNV